MVRVFVFFLLLGWLLTSSQLTQAQFVKNYQFDSPIVSILEKEHTLFVATQQNGVYVSTDRGKTWENRWYDRYMDLVKRVEWHAVNVNSMVFCGNRLLVATDGGIFVSDDQAFSWHRGNNPFEYISPAAPIIDSKPTYTSTYLSLSVQGTRIYCVERFFDLAKATYATRMIYSTDQGDNWHIFFQDPTVTVGAVTATATGVYIGGASEGKTWLRHQPTGSNQWQKVELNTEIGKITSIQFDKKNILISGIRDWKDEGGAIYGVLIGCVTSTDEGQHWQHADFPIFDGFINVPVHATTAAQGLFIVGLRSQIAYSTGSQWTTDTLGLFQPSALPEGGMLISRDTLWMGFQDYTSLDAGLQSRLPSSGHLVRRPLSDFQADRSQPLPPGLLKADARYRNQIQLSWQRSHERPYQYLLERSDNDPDHFQQIAKVSASTQFYTDTQVLNGNTYFYRLRTQGATPTQQSVYTPVLKVPKPQIRLRPAYLSRLEDVQMPSKDTLFARCGSELVRSTDGGQTWAELTPCFFSHARYDRFSSKFVSISFPTAKIGYGLIDTGMMLKTQDGGESWVLIPNLAGHNLVKIFFESPASGFAFVHDARSDGDLLYKTTDGGQTFRPVVEGLRLRALKRQNGLWVGLDNNQKLVFTADGNTWTHSEQTAFVPFVFSPKRFIVVERDYNQDVVKQTHDGGQTWEVLKLPVGYRDQIHAIQFINETVGFILGGPLNGTGRPAFVYRTIDGGASWVPIRTPELIRGEATELAFVGNHLFLVCEPDKNQDNLPYSFLGNVLRSTDAGETWEFVSNIHNSHDYTTASVSFSTPKNGVLLTRNTQGGYHNFYYQTVDGGINWLRKSLDDWAPLWQVKFINANDGFLIGPNLIYYTTDGGKQWSKQSVTAFSVTRLPYQYSAPGVDYLVAHDGYFQFLSAKYWVALSDDDKLYVSTNQGQTWQQLPTPVLQKPEFYFVTEKIGYVTVTGPHSNTIDHIYFGAQLYKTTDGGSTWAKVGPIRDHGLYFLTEHIGFAGKKRTSNGGKSWEPIAAFSENYYLGSAKYHFIDQKTGYAEGRLLTTDAGETWTSLAYLDETTLHQATMRLNTTMLAVDRLYTQDGVKLLPNAAPCNPVQILGDSTVLIEQTAQSTYKVQAPLYRPDIGYSWSINTGGTFVEKADSVTVTWDKATPANSFLLSVKAVNDGGESTPVNRLIARKLIITATQPSVSTRVDVFPNPTADRLHLKAPPSIKIQSVHWYQNDGKELHVPPAADGSYPVSHLPFGIYWIRIQLNSHQGETKRILIAP
ncbi:photosystem II stability/assembly factor-like uncharacterized protein [Larkinella arboricola]|uniref:Photosystem II stability/assembly factor-like uncharacterized protein n=1 Tax=Larkinella arboricola TaxID=643671 RepID=A0A327WL23_LARAB|nr:hypothetical protein [Larkinella arboricola]RAJ90841.1 photosystem II stability/assembly factor-like uncharacterized protein [Larkinella arboricola]